MFFHVLKNGLRIDALQLESIEKMERALAPHTVVARRIARLFHLSRAGPDLHAQLVFEPDEWQAVFIPNKKRPLNKPPTQEGGVGCLANCCPAAICHDLMGFVAD